MRNLSKYPLTSKDVFNDLNRLSEEVNKNLVPGDTTIISLRKILEYFKDRTGRLDAYLKNFP